MGEIKMTYRDSKHTQHKADLPDYEKDLASNEQSIKESKVRKRIDELLEEKRLKQLLDNSDDWEV
ncbi:hypothetical protein DXX92_03415 [Thalassotalea euphylliae]|uniref:Uncharacterized protein n=2 Tax=Thalassotalea euphylliae TaxID=1655234 RepID=A0A3E0UEE8_9GAMM|nr:hypothetical protein DXX92_03415 [Thalassotalea euphylliae]